MSGSEKRLEETRRFSGIEVDEEDKAPNSVPEPMKSDWMLSLRRPGRGRLCTSVKTPGGRRSVQGIIGYRRWSWFLENGAAGREEERLIFAEDELKGLDVWDCGTALILPEQKGNNRSVKVGEATPATWAYMQLPMQFLSKLLRPHALS